MYSSKTSEKSTSFCGLKHQPSFLSRFRSHNRTTSANSPAITEKPSIQTPYVPTYAASSFLSSTTPTTLDERYHQKQLVPLGGGRKTEYLGTIAERADDMRQRGRKRGEIKLELVTY